LIFERFFEPTLAQTSYLVACQETGQAIVIDPHRLIEEYIEVAEKQRLEIAAVTETHIHADYLSGARELAKKVGAKLLLSGEGGVDWQYAYASSEGARLLRDGDVFNVGTLQFKVVHTPGHTPEHLTFVLTDTTVSDQPVGAFTGDFIFAGDVGRPDLLERAAGIEGTMEAGARDLYRSLKRFREAFPEGLLIWPGHGAGSACGKKLGSLPTTSMGYEIASNWGLKNLSEESFVEAVLQGQPDPPRYFKYMKKLNREGPSKANIAIQEINEVPESALAIDVRDEVESLPNLAEGVVVLPVVANLAGKRHKFLRDFTTWAGWLLPYDRDIVIISDRQEFAERAVKNLALIGIDRVIGWMYPRDKGDGIRFVPPEDAMELAQSGATLIDVRNQNEYSEKKFPGAVHVPLSAMPDAVINRPFDQPLIVYCSAGYRSAIGASMLKAKGYENVSVVEGGLH